MNPGSPAAIEAGCVCPQEPNNNGAKMPTRDGWWIDATCDVHSAWLSAESAFLGRKGNERR